MGKVKAVALLSGGLDSTLSALLMKKWGVEVYGLAFITPFSSKKEYGLLREKLRGYYSGLGINLEIVELKEPYLEIVSKPKFDYGKNINPCIDCKILFLRLARKYMEELGADFIITGEVLDQRPMSQRLKTMMLIEKEAGVEGLVVRPLSGALLPPTKPELDGKIKREWLLDIKGRQRIRQTELAQSLGVPIFQQPAGGCLLTQPEFATKVKDLMAHNELTLINVELLKVGRHFRVSGIKVIVGRNEQENRLIEELGKGQGFIVKPLNTTGPTALVQAHSFPSSDSFSEILRLIGRYCDDKVNIDFEVISPSLSKTVECINTSMSKEEVEKFRIP